MASLAESLWFAHTLAVRDEAVWLKTEALHAHERVTALSNAVREDIDATYWLAESLSTHAEITEPMFEQLARALLWDRPWVLSVRWSPRVSEEARAEFEEDLARRQPGAFLFERSASGQRVPAQNRARYFPIAYTYP